KMNLWSMNPTEIRALLRNGQHRKESTGYWAAGYKQANLAIVPSKLAKDFEKFALANSGALPLLYVSKVGELTAGDWGKNSDIRTDAPAYQIYKPLTKKCYTVSDVDCSDMVTFYIGCSYSFSRILIENKLLTPNSKGVSMFRTNIDCYGSGPFQCKMIVSMKAISKTGLSKIHQITSKFSDVHGAPIHYGNPARIGIPDVNDYIGDPTDFLENDVPVFWCCGFTAVEALMQANVERAFTHWPNSVFITDVKQEDISLE
uniref:DUF1445 domain-containing protein n=1 Tax=Ciona savignyi TaxID=51511 RepID=H2Y4B2_CIOSA